MPAWNRFSIDLLKNVRSFFIPMNGVSVPNFWTILWIASESVMILRNDDSDFARLGGNNEIPDIVDGDVSCRVWQVG